MFCLLAALAPGMTLRPSLRPAALLPNACSATIPVVEVPKPALHREPDSRCQAHPLLRRLRPAIGQRGWHRCKFLVWMIEPALISKAHAAGVKVLVSIGGGDGIQGPRFNKISASETTRQTFVTSVYNLLTLNGYDGVDIDWEVPNAANRSDCTLLMQELRDKLPSPWLISMAVTADPRNYGTGLDIPALAPILDFMNVMTYDFYGLGSGVTGLVSPLFQDPADPQQAGERRDFNGPHEIQYGVPLSEMNIGTPSTVTSGTVPTRSGRPAQPAPVHRGTTAPTSSNALTSRDGRQTSTASRALHI